jgi:hypothetical protein
MAKPPTAIKVFVEIMPNVSESSSKPRVLTKRDNNIYTAVDNKGIVYMVYRGDIGPIAESKGRYYADGIGELITPNFYAKGEFKRARIIQGIIARREGASIIIHEGEFNNKLLLTGPNCKATGSGITIGDFIDGNPINVVEYNIKGQLLFKCHYNNHALYGKHIEYKPVSEKYTSVKTSIYVDGKLVQITGQQLITTAEYEAMSIDPTIPKICFDPNQAVREYKKEIATKFMTEVNTVCTVVHDIIMGYL